MYDILFVSRYSDENYSIGKNFIEENVFSACVFYNQEDNYSCKMDYINNVTEGFDKSNQRCLVLEDDIYSEDICKKLYDIINFMRLNPDVIVFKGEAEEFWPLATIKEFSEMDIPVFLLLENVKEKYDDDITKIINIADKIILTDNIKIKNIDDKKISYPFLGFDLSKLEMSKVINPKKMDRIIFFTNKDNFNNIRNIVQERVESPNIVALEELNSLDIAILSSMNKFLVDCTDNELFSIVAEKLNNVLFTFDDFINNKINVLYTEYKREYKKVSNFIYKEICLQLENYLKEAIVITAKSIDFKNDKEERA